MTKLRAEAFAKVNRSLRVLGERQDGYHELDTVLQTIDLADTLEIEKGDGSLVIETSDPSLPVDDRNLVHRAGTLLARGFGVAASAHIRLAKRIPSGAGLGGGSSDAAVALALLARLWKLPLDAESAGKIALELGSDVPFFLHGGAARARGRGERLTELPEGPERRLLLVVPPFSLSTARVYQILRPRGEGPAPTRGQVRREDFFGENDLAPAALELEPKLLRYWDILAELFPDCAVSGSGSCLAAAINAPGESGSGDRPEKRIAELRRRLPEAVLLVQETLSRREYQHRSTVDFQKEVMHP